MTLQPLAGIAARYEYRQGFAAKRVDYTRGVDAAAARGFAAGINVCAIFKCKTIDADRAIDRRVER